MEKVRKIFAAFAACVLSCAIAMAQTGYTTVSTSLLGGSNNLVVNGTIYWQPVSGSPGSPTGARIGSDGGQITLPPYQATVTNGVSSVSLPDALASDPEICYAVTVVNNVTGAAVLGAGLDQNGHVQTGGPYGCVQPTGSTWSFDSYVPPVAPPTIYQPVPGPTGPAGAGYIPGLSSDGSNGISVAKNVAVGGALTSVSPISTPGVNTVLYADHYCTTAGTYDQSCFNNAIAALPSCSIANWYDPYTPGWGSWTFDHCGRVIAGAHAYTFSSGVTVDSNAVQIEGDSPNATVVYSTMNGGAAFLFEDSSSSTMFDDFHSSGGIRNVSIDGYGAGANSYGIETSAMSAFRMSGVTVSNFTKSGSAGWYDTVPSSGCFWNEKRIVDISLSNNNIGWYGYLPPEAGCSSFGYGDFNVKIENMTGQTGVLFNGVSLAYSFLQIIVNQISTSCSTCATNSTAISFTNDTNVTQVNYMFHVESGKGGPGTGNDYYEDSGSSFSGVGVWDTADPNPNNSISGAWSPLAFPGETNGYPAAGTTWTSSSGFPSAFQAVLTQTTPNLNGGSALEGSASYTGSSNLGGYLTGVYGLATQNGLGTFQQITGLSSQVATKLVGASVPGAVTNGFGLFAQSPSLATGSSIANVYGVYIAAQAATGITSPYGIYQAGTSDKNVLNGITQAAGFVAASGDSNTTCWNTNGGVSNCDTLAASLTTTGATSDNLTVTGMTSSGHCTLSPTNASAATNITTTYVSAKTANQITVTHTATSGMTYDVLCTPF
jgi:hypothetical protein